MKKIISAALMLVMASAFTLEAFASSGITREEAERIALRDANASRSKVSRFESEKEHGRYEIEFVKDKTGSEFEYKISSKGTILEKSVDLKYKRNSSRSKIGEKAARKKVANFSGIGYNTIRKGTIKYEYDEDDKEGSYTVRFTYRKYRYKYEVLAPNGKIMEYEKKYRK